MTQTIIIVFTSEESNFLLKNLKAGTFVSLSCKEVPKVCSVHQNPKLPPGKILLLISKESIALTSESCIIQSLKDHPIADNCKVFMACHEGFQETNPNLYIRQKEQNHALLKTLFPNLPKPKILTKKGTFQRQLLQLLELKQVDSHYLSLLKSFEKTLNDAQIRNETLKFLHNTVYNPAFNSWEDLKTIEVDLDNFTDNFREMETEWIGKILDYFIDEENWNKPYNEALKGWIEKFLPKEKF